MSLKHIDDIGVVLMTTGGPFKKVLMTMVKELALQKCTEVDTATEALSLAKEGKVNVIFYEVGKTLDGALELLELVRGDYHLDELPIVVITAALPKEEALKLVRAGATEMLIKPFHKEALEEVIIRVGSMYSFHI